MALLIKPTYEVHKDALSLTVKDKTGLYTAENLGGWGIAGTPNPDISDSCIFVVVVRKASTGDEYLLCDNPMVYDPLAVNTKITSFLFTWKNDGVHEIYMGRLRVSNDGLNYINAGGVIAEGDYFYYNEKAWLMGASVAAEVTLISLIEEPSVVQGTCFDLMAPRLAIEKQKLYKEYRKKREPNYDDGESIFSEMLKLREDIQGSVYAYYSGLKIEGQDQIETLLDKYQLA